MSEPIEDRKLTPEERFVVGLRDKAVEVAQEKNRRALPDVVPPDQGDGDHE